MAVIWELRDKATRRLIAQCTSSAACMREAAWRNLPDDQWCLATVEREPSCGCSIPIRYMQPWPQEKIDEFIRLYMSDLVMLDLEEHFQTSATSLGKLARRLGLLSKPERPENWEKHGGRWTEREEGSLINLYREEARQPWEIITELDRTESSVKYRLTKVGIYRPRAEWTAMVSPWSRREVALVRFFCTHYGVAPAQLRDLDTKPLGINSRFAALGYYLAQHAMPDAVRPHLRPWSVAEEVLVSELHREGRICDEIALYLERSPAAIRNRLVSLGLFMRARFADRYPTPPKPSARLNEQDELMNFMYDEGIGINEIAQHLERLPHQVSRRLQQTAGSLSTRSRSGRFIRPGKGSIRRILEKTRGDYAEEYDSGEACIPCQEALQSHVK